MSKPADVPFEATLQVRDTCLCLHVQRAARALARRFDEALRPHGLTSGQFSLLMSLNRPEAPNMGSVASLLAMDRTTLTAALKPLERRGLVTEHHAGQVKVLLGGLHVRVAHLRHHRDRVRARSRVVRDCGMSEVRRAARLVEAVAAESVGGVDDRRRGPHGAAGVHDLDRR